MKVVILAGGLGTRIGEETVVRPKPLIEIGEKPILWHIMKGFSHFGFNEFVVCLGYKGYQIKEYFANYSLHESDVTFDFAAGRQEVIHANHVEPWRVTLVDTGLETLTGGRLKRIKKYVGDGAFMMTYGDGVADVDRKGLLAQHQKSGKLATVTAVQPLGRFGAISLSADGRVERFQEKAQGEGSWINAGFFVLEPKVIDYIKDDATLFEKEPVERLAREGQLMAFKHPGFWHPMDTLRDKNYLEELWRSGRAPWKLWA